ncbi:MAG: tape measure protein, partial [Erysipelotrichia bacterium]|nr:tape measure protein [Erysipelotrichia bacterium]
MSNIDERIVKMVFDNKEFDKNVETSKRSLEEFETKLKLDGIASSLEVIASRFSTMGIVGMEVIGRITNAAIDMGKKLQSAVVGQMLTGGKKRALNLEQAYFQLEGLEMDAAAVIENVNYAVDNTAYGLDEAAKVAAQFGASGMQAGDDMARALRAVSGVASMTGSSYEDVGRIFIKVAGNGRLMGQELLQLSGRGINAAATLAGVMGKTEQEVREMVSKGQISFEMFYNAMHDAFGKHAAKANETFTGALSNMKAALSRIGADFYTPFLTYARDVFNAIRPFINGIRSAIAPLVEYTVGWMDTISKGLIKFFEGLDPSQITQYIQPIINIFEHLLDIAKKIVKPIADAYKVIFPSKGHAAAVETLEWLGNVIESYKPKAATLEKIGKIFEGIFSAFALFKEIAFDVFRSLEYVLWPIFDLIKRVFFSLATNVADLIIKFTNWYKTSEALRQGISKVTEVLAKITYGLVEYLDKFAEWVRTSPKVAYAYTKIKEIGAKMAEGLRIEFDKLKGIFGGLIKGGQAFAEAIKRAFTKSGDAAEKSKLVVVLTKLWEIVKAITAKIWEVIKEIGKGISEALGGIDFDTILKTINTMSLGMIANSIRKFFNKDRGLANIVKSIKDILSSVRSVLEAWTLTIKADALMKIATAVAILAASLFALSLIDQKKLGGAIAAITLLFVDLMGAMSVMGKMQGGGRSGIGGVIDAYALKTMTEALTSIATAVLIMSAALKVVASIDEDKAMQGIFVIGAMTAMLVATVKALEKVKPARLKTISTSMILFATALVIMGSAVKKLSKLEWDELGKGLAGVAGLLLIIAGFTRIVGSPEKMISMGIGFNFIATSMLLFAAAMKKFAKMSWEDIGKGLTGIAGVLLALAIAVNLMPEKRMLTISTGILIIGVAMQLLTRSLIKFGQMSWEDVGKALLVLASSMIIFSIALNSMEGTLGASAALLVASAAMLVLAGVLKIYSKMSWEEIAKALVVLAGSLAILTIAGYAMKPIIGIVVAAAGAMTLFGLGLALVGVGLLAISAALTAFTGSVALSATLVTKAIQVIVMAFVNLIPEILVAIGKGIIAILTVIKDSIKTIVDTVVAVVVAVLNGIKDTIPTIIETVAVLLDALLPFLVEYIPKMINALVDALIGTLKGLVDRIPELVQVGVEIILSILKGIISTLDDVVQALFDLLIGAINAVAKAIKNSTSGIASAIADLIKAFVGLIFEIFKELFSLSTGDALDIIDTMSTAIFLLAGAMALAGTAAPTGIAGALALVEFVGIIALLLTALGALNKIPGFQSLIESGGELLATLGYAIGNFIGSIIGGLGAGLTSGLPAIGENLSAFMINLEPFIAGAKRLNAGAFDGVKEIVDVILLLTMASVFDGISKFLFAGTTSFSTFGEELSTFGSYFAKYYNTIKHIKPDVVDASANAIGAMAVLSKNLPKQGGLWQKVTGSATLATFGKGLVEFAGYLKDYQAALGTGIKVDLIESST